VISSEHAKIKSTLITDNLISMALIRYTKIEEKTGRETVFFPTLTSNYQQQIRMYANGLLNSHGGVIYIGVGTQGLVTGLSISRKDEDRYRLAIDRVFSCFQPFVSSQHYRLNFLEVTDSSSKSNFVVIEIKVSVGDIGEIYEDGQQSVYLVDEKVLIGPLFPQELKELILLKYKEVIEGAEEVNRYLTPNLATARKQAKISTATKRMKPLEIIAESYEDTSLVVETEKENKAPLPINTTKTVVKTLNSTTVASVKENAVPLSNQPDTSNKFINHIVNKSSAVNVTVKATESCKNINKLPLTSKTTNPIVKKNNAAVVAVKRSSIKAVTSFPFKTPALKPKSPFTVKSKVKTVSKPVLLKRSATVSNAVLKRSATVYTPISYLLQDRQVQRSHSYNGISNHYSNSFAGQQNNYVGQQNNFAPYRGYNPGNQFSNIGYYPKPLPFYEDGMYF